MNPPMVKMKTRISMPLLRSSTRMMRGLKRSLKRVKFVRRPTTRVEMVSQSDI